MVSDTLEELLGDEVKGRIAFQSDLCWVSLEFTVNTGSAPDSFGEILVFCIGAICNLKHLRFGFGDDIYKINPET